MPNFNNQAYEAMLQDLLNDAFYLVDRSLRGKASTIRQYAEIVVRKLLDMPDGQRLNLGSPTTKKSLVEKSNNDHFLISSVEMINAVGSKFTHTEELSSASEQDVHEMVLALFDLYAYLFIDYFRRHAFGENECITSAFSILPPTVRYLSLSVLYSQDPANLILIDKLSLATLKAFDEEAALAWLDERKEQLSALPSISEKGARDMVESFGHAIAEKLVESAPSMYELCAKRVRAVAKTIDQHGPLYYDFESAIELYRKVGFVEGESEGVKEFNSLMEFVYMGRRPRPGDVKNNPGDYLTIE
ncbi:hypothetical protein [Burkholderia cepacia]|uniref:hypothetical protein n=1 Tax=Burkholderia cepacia TaxID=292 RepID=UPI002AB6CABB|nr:hypothetical protein [Burkholderia cepacia]